MEFASKNLASLYFLALEVEYISRLSMRLPQLSVVRGLSSERSNPDEAH